MEKNHEEIHNVETVKIDKHEYNIRVVLFDMGGVIADDLFVPFIKGIENFIKIEFDQDKVHDKMKKLWNIIKVDKNYSEETYLTEVLTSFPQLHITVEDLKHIVRDTFHPFYGTIAIVERLSKSNKHKIGILSNHADKWFAAMLDKFSLHKLFKDPSLVISSHEVGFGKPDKEIYAFGYDRVKVLLPDIKKKRRGVIHR